MFNWCATVWASLKLICVLLVQSQNPLYSISGDVVMGPDLLLHQQVGITASVKILSGGVADRIYFCPDPSEISTILTVAKSDMKYSSEVYDCDDYSYWYKGELQRQWRKAGHEIPLPIIQVFAVIRLKDTGEIVAHAFNGLIDSTGHVLWIEPQSNKIMNIKRFDFLEIYALWV